MKIFKLYLAQDQDKGKERSKDDYTASFYLTNIVKDLDLALRMAYNLGLTLPATASAEAIFRASETLRLSKNNCTSVAAYLLRVNGFNSFSS
jgi:3-hydroxyisobutyrate dehydrogenase-like beta-hydroxyacid dehydrogenase